MRTYIDATNVTIYDFIEDDDDYSPSMSEEADIHNGYGAWQSHYDPNPQSQDEVWPSDGPLADIPF